MGNQWSFYFGSSVLSVAEIAELVFDVIAMVIIMKYAKYKKNQVSNNNESPYVIRMEGLTERTLPNAPQEDQELPSYLVIGDRDTKPEQL